MAPDVTATLDSQPEVRVIVSLAAAGKAVGSDTIAQTRDATAEQQGRVLAALGDADFVLGRRMTTVPALSGFLRQTGVPILDCHPDVLAVSLSGDYTTALEESRPLVEADQVHMQGFTGGGVDVAVFDTGIDTSHPDLITSIIGEACFTNVVPGIPCPPPPHPAEDGHGHGTHVSGIITSDLTCAQPF